MFTWTFWKDALERAIRTGAQVTIPTISAAIAAGSLGAIDWTSAGVIIGGSVGLSLLMSLGGSFRGNPEDPSLVK